MVYYGAGSWLNKKFKTTSSYSCLLTWNGWSCFGERKSKASIRDSTGKISKWIPCWTVFRLTWASFRALFFSLLKLCEKWRNKCVLNMLVCLRMVKQHQTRIWGPITVRLSPDPPHPPTLFPAVKWLKFFVLHLVLSNCPFASSPLSLVQGETVRNFFVVVISYGFNSNEGRYP